MHHLPSLFLGQDDDNDDDDDEEDQDQSDADEETGEVQSSYSSGLLHGEEEEAEDEDEGRDEETGNIGMQKAVGRREEVCCEQDQ